MAKPALLTHPTRVAELLAHHDALLQHADWRPAQPQPGLEAWTLQTTAPIPYVRCAVKLYA